MNWHLILQWLNFGMGAVVLGLLAKENNCAKNLQDGFFSAGYLLLILLAIMIVVNAAIAVNRCRRKR
jgi:hypothetical protein